MCFTCVFYIKAYFRLLVAYCRPEINYYAAASESSLNCVMEVSNIFENGGQDMYDSHQKFLRHAVQWTQNEGSLQGEPSLHRRLACLYEVRAHASALPWICKRASCDSREKTQSKIPIVHVCTVLVWAPHWPEHRLLISLHCTGLARVRESDAALLQMWWHTKICRIFASLFEGDDRHREGAAGRSRSA